jgi:hypothetical protein
MKTNYSSTTLLKDAGIGLAHLAVMLITFLVFRFLGFVDTFPDEINLKNWDAGWLYSIVESGYSFTENDQSNLAFFPLFPLIWKFLSLTTIQVSIFNGIVFIIASLILKNYLKISNQLYLILLSVPSLIFCFLPYAESLFFLGGAILLYGLKKSFPLACLGILMASTTRSVSLIFIPIIIVLSLMNIHDKHSLKHHGIRAIILITVSALGTLLTLYYQYLETGVWFALFEVTKNWNREFSIPSLFFTTWDSGRLIWLDGSGFLIGLISFLISLKLLYLKIKDREKVFPPDFLFALGYLTLTVCTVIFYTFEDSKGGSTLLSLNRYIFATPFFWIFLVYVLRMIRPSYKNILLFTLILLLNWTLFDFWGVIRSINMFPSTHTSTVVYFLIVSLYCMTYFLCSNEKILKTIWSGLYVVNVGLQMFLFNTFLKLIWVG